MEERIGSMKSNGNKKKKKKGILEKIERIRKKEISGW